MTSHPIHRLHLAGLLAAALTLPTAAPAGPLTFQTALQKTGRSVSFLLVSGDGMVLAGTTVVGGIAVPYRHDACSGLSLLSKNIPSGSSGTWAMDLSADGRTVIGHAGVGFYPRPVTVEGFVWTPPDGYLGIGNLSGTSTSVAMRLSPDGATLIGQSLDQGTPSCFYWDPKTGIQACATRFPDFPADMTQPVHVSNDALTVWGNGYDNGYKAVYWRHGSPPVRFTDLAGGNNSVSVAAVTADSKLAYGSGSTDNGLLAVRFDESGGVTPLFPCGIFQSSANAVTTDGRMVVGYVDYNLSTSSMSATDSFIFDSKTGQARLLSDFLAAYVPETTGWKNLHIIDISGDGDVMIGEGIDPENNYTSWILEGARNYLIPMDEPLAIHASKRMTLNRQTGMFDQKITVTNLSPFEIGGYEIRISNLPTKVRVDGSKRRKDSVRVIRVEKAIAPENSVDLLLHYYTPKRGQSLHPKVTVTPLVLD